MIQVHVTMTGKSYSPRDKYRCFAEETHNFPDLDAAKQWAANTYGNCSRSPMYGEFPDGDRHIGYIYGFRASDISHVPVDKWLQRDWVEFREVTPITP